MGTLEEQAMDALLEKTLVEMQGDVATTPKEVFQFLEGVGVTEQALREAFTRRLRRNLTSFSYIEWLNEDCESGEGQDMVTPFLRIELREPTFTAKAFSSVNWECYSYEVLYAIALIIDEHSGPDLLIGNEKNERG